MNYSEKHNGYLPVADIWCDLLLEDNTHLTKENFRHPQIEGSLIAFNKNISGMCLTDVDKNTVLLFEAKGSWNLAGGKNLIKTTNPNRKVVDVLLLNGKIVTCWVEFVEGKTSYEDTVESLRWKS